MKIIKIIRYAVNPFFNFAMNFVLLFSVIYFNLPLTVEFIIALSVLLISINIISIIYLYRNSSWGYFYLSFVIYVLFVLLYLFFKIYIAHSREDEEYVVNLGFGMVLTLIFAITTTSLVIGNFLGLLLKSILYPLRR